MGRASLTLYVTDTPKGPGIRVRNIKAKPAPKAKPVAEFNDDIPPQA
jgi:hypothetical protein